jgi:hypothetical protein
MESDPPPGHDTHESSWAEPVRFDEALRDVLTPMGQVDSIGSFARGFGTRQVKILIGITGAVLLALTLLNAVQ